MIKLPVIRKLNCVKAFTDPDLPKGKPIPSALKSEIIQVMKSIGPNSGLGRYGTSSWVPFTDVDIRVSGGVYWFAEIMLKVPKEPTGDNGERFARKLASVICPEDNLPDWAVELSKLHYSSVRFKVYGPEEDYPDSCTVQLPDNFDSKAARRMLQKIYEEPILKALTAAGIEANPYRLFGFWDNPDDRSIGSIKFSISTIYERELSKAGIQYAADLIAYAAAPSYTQNGVQKLNVKIEQGETANHNEIYQFQYNLNAVRNPGSPPANLFADARGFDEQAANRTFQELASGMEHDFISRFSDAIRYKAVYLKQLSDDVVQLNWITQEDFNYHTANAMAKQLAESMTTRFKKYGISTIKCRIACRDGRPSYDFEFHI